MDLLALLGAASRASRKGIFQGFYNPAPSSRLSCVVFHSRLRRMSAPKHLQLQPWEMCFQIDLSSAMFLRKQELSGHLKDLKRKPAVLLLCFQPLQRKREDYSENSLNKGQSVELAVAMTHPQFRCSRRHYCSGVVCCWKLVSETKPTQICCTGTCVAPDFVADWMSSLRAVLTSLDRAGILQVGGSASANATPHTVACLAAVWLI